ncbi:MAG: GNAT family N-acetyltransferase [Chloroflexi bacterium]|jgi:diamine N-acetyltransferase|nr:GNAT family N-acetyltransferase [Chloroflexota bacterium]MBT4003957.1 GNAT family N-acetyltransferase [Chloroflexota bacterium]MBT4305737.1 GNAT family N-acetyltransferase [Chloroflexota bacterium]MBT4533561.1 GNAT family N-acetyltransferase [Chloroflexota bacterium]MBT4681796.1 GNAT family N-acetyltransferase [Chloroflexota bacterium]
MIYGERIRLRAPEREFIPLFFDWINDPEVRHGLTIFKPMSIAGEEIWFEKMLKLPEHEQPFTIEVKDENGKYLPIGNIGLFDIDWIARKSEFGIMIGRKDHWDQGLGTDTIKLFLEYCFNTLNLNCVRLSVYSYNTRAQHVYENIGFVHEGVLRQSIFRFGEYHDEIKMSVLRSEWLSGKQK